ncbi:SPOR domain-containing protein [uncultured Mediterranea sp.]|uniref:SPOR domain-containing protein n=1 Tax=uncultured Mediterranea sp. TaxID=1926662 RepID=UPI0027D93425|nr:SPOR domain-containing protein [uncultured Mediterranea sp.]
MKRLLLALAGLSFLLSAAAQDNIVKSLERNVPGQGKITIHQDERIEALVGKTHTVSATGERQVIKTSGYRVQVYAGSNTRAAKNEAHSVAASVKEIFPDLPVYSFFTPPRWLCRVGDYRSIEEADAMMRQLRATGKFKEVSIVRDQINIPL